jgi:HSP20 family protein
MANIVRREPMREMLSLREAMDRLFEESFVGPRGWMGLGSEAVSLPLDVYQTENEIVVTAPVPGIRPEDIDISIAGDTLTIKGETTAEERVEEGNYIRQERRYGRFERSLTLPVEVQADKADATFENGVLMLSLPKAEAVKPKQIKVTVK